MRIHACIALALGTFLATPNLIAAEANLSLRDAQRLAVARSRQLNAQDHAVAASREMAVAARQLPDPVLKIGIDNLPVSGPDRFDVNSDFMTMRRVGVMQELVAGDKRRLRGEKFTGAAEKSLAEKRAATAAIERDTALAWLELYYARENGALIDALGAQARLELQAAEGAYRGGRGSRADLIAARAAIAMIDDRAADANRRIRNARTLLARWTGAAAAGGNVALVDKPATDAIRLDPARLDTQLAHHPEIAVLTRQQDIAETDARLAQANRSTDWSVEVAFQQRGPAYSNMLSVGLSIPVPWDRPARQDREVAARLAMVEQARAERDEMLRDHVAQTRALIDEWESGRARQRRYASELIPLANERIAAVLTAYQGGKASLADLLGARRAEVEVRQQALQLEADTARLWARLNFLTPLDGDPGGATLPNDAGQK